jgi:hypothetical protein
MHIFARCGQACTLTLRVPADGSFADVRAALLSKRPKLAACEDLVGLSAKQLAWSRLFMSTGSQTSSMWSFVRRHSHMEAGYARMARRSQQHACSVTAPWTCSGDCGAVAEMEAPLAPSHESPIWRCTCPRSPTRYALRCRSLPCNMSGCEPAVLALYN